MNSRAIFLLSIVVLIFALPLNANAHGDDGGHAPKKTTVVTPPRVAASKLSTVDPHLIQTMLDGSHVPKDVAIVRCNFTESSPCRGIAIALVDSKGEKLSLGNSGSDGWIAFQGLNENQPYVFRIESAKYTGEISLQSGEIKKMTAGRLAISN